VIQQQANAIDTKNNIAQKQMLLPDLPDSDPRKQSMMDLLYNDIMQQGKVSCNNGNTSALPSMAFL
jgi:hypothetical protein